LARHLGGKKLSLLEQLKVNKGTTSNAFSKKIAMEILNGNKNLLKETIPLVTYNISNKKDKNIRSGAASIIDSIASENPKIISPYLGSIFSALEAFEPQTRWIIIRTIGICSSINIDIAKKTIPYAKKYLVEKVEGQLCLAAATEGFLAAYGSISKENANEVFPILNNAISNILPNEHDWLIEAFTNISQYLTKKQKDIIIDFLNDFKSFPRKSTQKRISVCMESLSK
jgi:hypothetical protein